VQREEPPTTAGRIEQWGVYLKGGSAQRGSTVSGRVRYALAIPMAVCVPDRLPNHASDAEKRVCDLLRHHLAADCIVYYEAHLGRRHPAFVVIDPGQGLLAIDIKGWLPQNLIGGDHERITVKDRHGRLHSCEHPRREARNYLDRLRDRCRQSLWAQHLLQPGDQFFFPLGSFAVLSNISRRQLAGSAWDVIFSAPDVITRDELEAAFVNQASTGLGRFFDPSWPFPAMTEFQVKTLRAIIHPELLISNLAAAAAVVPAAAVSPEETAIPGVQWLQLGPSTPEKAAVVDEIAVEVVSAPRPGTPPSLDEGLLDFRVLDLKQELVVRDLGSGPRLVFGAAGSGKTIVLLARARLLAHGVGRRVLLVCCNASLGSCLERNLAEAGRLITVRHFDKLAHDYGVIRRTYPAESQGELGRRLLARFRVVAPELRYDAVLVDEAQDFDPIWFQCARCLLHDPDHGDLLIVGDGNQGVYGKRRASWSNLGLPARGHTARLGKNYRNAREIMRFAAPFARTAAGEDDGVSPIAFDPAQAARSSGVPPVVIRAKDRFEECAHAIDLVAGLLRGRFGVRQLSHPLRPADIGVLVPAVRQELIETFAQFRRDLHAKAIPFVWVSNRADKTARARVGDPGVKLLNIFHAKGLQFKAVVFLWADILPQAGWLNRTPEEQETLFYVALTRAEDYLAVVHSRESEFVARLTGKG
jgi:hypothetical protein